MIRKLKDNPVSRISLQRTDIARPTLWFGENRRVAIATIGG